MLDIGASELLLVAALSLVVLGPEQLMTAIRHVSLAWRRLRNYGINIKDEFDKELRLQEIKKHTERLKKDLNPIAEQQENKSE